MKLICESCHTRYSISDEKVQGKNKVFKIKCRNCGETISVKGLDRDGAGDAHPADADEDAATTIAPAPLEAVAADGDEWFVVLGGEQVGPLSRTTVLEHLSRGAIDGESFVWRQGFDDWRKLSEVDALKHLAASASVQPAPQAVAPLDDDATVMDDRLPDDVRAVVEAHARSSQAPAAEPADDELDMTRMIPQGALEAESASRIEAARAEEPAPVAAAPVAAAKPEPAKAQPVQRSLDSFFGDDDEDDAPQAPAAASEGFFGEDDQSANRGAMLYQRRETSVLFSLNEFKKDKSKPESPVLASPDARTQGSGLIDIRAVAKKETKARQARQTAGDLFADFGGDSTAAEAEAPVELNTRLDAVVASAPLLQKKSSKAPMWIGIAAVLVIGGVAGGWYVITSNQEKVEAQKQAEAAKQAAAEVQRAADEKAEEAKEAAAAAAKLAAEKAEADKVAAEAAAAEKLAAEKKAAEEAAAKQPAGEQPAGEQPAGEQPAGEQVAANEQPAGEQPAEQPAPSDPAKAAADKAAREAAAKKAAEAKKKAAEAKEKQQQIKEVATPTEQKQPIKQPVVAQNTSANSATDLLNTLQAAREQPKPPTNDGATDGGGDVPKKLSASVVRKVIRQHQGKVVGCYRSNGGAGSGAVTINTSITVGGDGSVRSARVTTGEYSGNAVGSCIVGALRGMSFPKFDADSQSINIPFRVQ
jgi:predicted Zn finger-like uncharacterized protein